MKSAVLLVLGFAAFLFTPLAAQAQPEEPRFLLELDALGGGPGRVEDLNLEIGYQVNPKLLIRAGYRTVEGGADVDEVFSFSWLNYGVVSATFSF